MTDRSPAASGSTTLEAVAARRARVAKAAPISLAPRLSAASAFEAVTRICLQQADINERLIDVEGPVEAVHQYRVAYRRLRSLFSLYAKVARRDSQAATIKAGLREVTVAFGSARDLDVFRMAHPELTPADARRLELARATAYETGLAFLASPGWAQTRAGLDAWLADGRVRRVLPTVTWSGRARAAQAMDRRRARILRSGVDLAALNPHDRHQVRIEAKKVRYGAQFFGAMWPAKKDEVKAMESLLGQLQDELGSLNDAATWAHIEQLAGLQDVQPPDVDVAARIAAAQELVDQLRERPPFWATRPGRAG